MCQECRIRIISAILAMGIILLSNALKLTLLLTLHAFMGLSATGPLLLSTSHGPAKNASLTA